MLYNIIAIPIYRQEAAEMRRQGRNTRSLPTIPREQPQRP